MKFLKWRVNHPYGLSCSIFMLTMGIALMHHYYIRESYPLLLVYSLASLFYGIVLFLFGE